KKADDPESIFQKVKQQIDMFFYMKLNIEDLAEKHAVSSSYLRKIFKTYSGMSPKAYLNHVRNEHAMKLLMQSSKSIQEIAYECGYTDPLYFSTLFKKMNGMSPRCYRRQAQH